MAYRYALSRENYEDLSTGSVLYSAPGYPAFPVRLASEIFQRARQFQSHKPVTVWDPCCGSGYLLTVLAFLHRKQLSGVLGTDLEPSALELARKNLALLSKEGLAARSKELKDRAARWSKPSYIDAAVATSRLADRLAAEGGDLPHLVARADVFEPDELHRALNGHRPKLVITDVPYGERTHRGGSNSDSGIVGMLRALGSVLDRDAIIAVTIRGRKVQAPGHHPISSFKVGTRAVALYRPAN